MPPHYSVPEILLRTLAEGTPIRDLDEMTNAGFKALARRLCVGHAYVVPVRWNCEVEVFGQRIQPGQLIHADKHGFIALTAEEIPHILDAARFMDSNECNTVIAAARNVSGLTAEEMLKKLDDASSSFGRAARERFKSGGEW